MIYLLFILINGHYNHAQNTSERFMLNRMDERESIESDKKEGRDEEKLRMAQAMLAKNLDVVLTAEMTGLSIAEIQRLEKSPC
ncbi:MAG: hypothetical protein HC877_08150 [Thioploca sp.]|nr:hypothetical protein [Thioploca sp.]